MSKIYLISLYYKKDIVTGANKRFEEIIKNLLKFNIDFKIIVSKGEIPEFLPKKFVLELDYKNRLHAYFLLEKFLLGIDEKAIIINDFMPIPLFASRKNMNIKLYQLIHDIRNFTEFNRTRNKILGQLFQKFEWKLVKNIITVSNFSKNQIEKYIGINSNNIIVSYNGIDKSIFFNQNIKREIDLLYIATFEKRKNHINLIKALNKLPRNLNVVFIGKDLGYLNYIKNKIKEYNLFNIKIFDNIGSEENLAKIYNKTKIFISPSLYEGFGMPLIEAFFCGCKVCCNNLEVFREIGGSNFIYFDANDPEDIKNKILLSLNENINISRNSYLEKNFDWKNITYKLLKDLKVIND